MNLTKIISALLFFSTMIFSQNDNSITTVDSVDLQKYVGTWYEIAKIPNSFQDQCSKNTTATYKINEDGDIEVLNKCVDTDNEIDDADGIARVVNKKTNAKLEVSFVSLFGWHLFWGDYWIIGLDKDYRYAVVGTPSRKYGWILSRTPQMEKDDLDICFRILEKNGYNKDSFEFDVQEN